MRTNRSKFGAGSLNIFMNTHSHEEKNKFLQYCINHALVPSEKSFESYRLVISKTQKIVKVAMNIANTVDQSTVCDLIKFVIDLVDEIDGSASSEGLDLDTEIVLNAKRWIKENIGE